MNRKILAFAFFAFVFPAFAPAQDPSPSPEEKHKDSEAMCPMHQAHSKMNERGEKGMGFSQTATTHHFFLSSQGGIIQVEAKDPKDTATRDTIRTHLAHIAHAFASGDFDIPTFVHDSMPPGAPEMKERKAKISYAFEEKPNGGRVIISTSDPESLAAIHKFLRFQIEQHQTQDSTAVH
jgi:hypothetical protein